MKKLLIILFVSLAFSGLSSAHSGRTDAKGGHWNHSTDSYHYHSKPNGSNSSNQDFLYNLLDSDDYPDLNQRCKYGTSIEPKGQCIARHKAQLKKFAEQILNGTLVGY